MFTINGLYTDHYELTMAQGYYLSGRQTCSACFDYFFRINPFNGGYVVFAGLADLLEVIKNYTFNGENLDYLKSIGFRADFLNYLEEFVFKGKIYAPDEGEVVFPYEPFIRVEGNVLETQVIETVLLNLLNFQSLIATKASRMRQSAGNRLLLDFGLRRAQGFGGILASRSAIIGGFDGTSNVFSASEYQLLSTGTMAHSWIQSYPTELESFRDFTKFYPEKCILLVDTYDTLRSGLPNTIKVARELEKKGAKLEGIRLDSGDLGYLSKKAREILDKNGLDYVKIFVSNQLDEYIIKSLIEQHAPVDGFGVGTKLVTGGEDAALDGVYKLSEFNNTPQLKISDNLEKMTLPGRKNILRFYDDQGMLYGDAIILEEEKEIDIMHHPYYPGKSCSLKKFRNSRMLKKVMDNGTILLPGRTAKEIAEYVRKKLSDLPDEHKRFENPHIYKVGISEKLMDLRNKLIDEIKSKY
jgi:nicotinate phosphoribosyltransferase